MVSTDRTALFKDQEKGKCPQMKCDSKIEEVSVDIFFLFFSLFLNRRKEKGTKHAVVSRQTKMIAQIPVYSKRLSTPLVKQE